MLRLATTADLQCLIDDEIQESLTLDYKASASLAKDSKSRDELCKDVSAFANSAGGQIIYGIEEKDRLPTKIDAGSELTREWIEQVIGSNIQPRLQGLVITPIQLSAARYAYLLTIPASKTAHQAPDKKYYRRFNFESVPMHDYEIRDVMKRAMTPQPFVALSFNQGDKTTTAQLNRGLDMIVPVPLIVRVGNRSLEPALYTLVTLGLDAQLEINDYGGFDRGAPTETSRGHSLIQVHKRVNIPHDLPIFQELEFRLGERPLCFSFEFRTPSDEYLVRCTVHTPGFSRIEDWIIHRSGTRLTLQGPLPPIHSLDEA